MESLQNIRSRVSDCVGLSQYGWTVIDSSIHEQKRLAVAILQIASELGHPVPLRLGQDVVSILSPRHQTDGLPNSFTAAFGTGAFPLHTDTAHWERPARYVVLGCLTAGSSERQTIILPWQNLKFNKRTLEEIQTGIFMVRNRKNSFYTQILDSSKRILRVDFQAMIPKNTYAFSARAAVQEQLGKTPKTVKMKWSPGRILIMDNWKVLHARGESSMTDSDRQLMRVLVQA